MDNSMSRVFQKQWIHLAHKVLELSTWQIRIKTGPLRPSSEFATACMHCNAFWNPASTSKGGEEELGKAVDNVDFSH